MIYPNLLIILFPWSQWKVAKMEILIISIFVVPIVLIWWLSVYFDKKRIHESAERLGYKNVKIRWAPFAPGAFFSNGPHYYVTYTGKDKDHHFSYCKTSFLSGEYWRDERDVYSSSSCLVAIIFFIFLFFGLYHGIAMAIHWLR